MRYVTPTGLAEEAYQARRARRNDPPRLGSTLAMVDALPSGSVIIVADDSRRACVQALVERVRPGCEFRYVLASQGYHALEGLAGQWIGVDAGALEAVPEHDRSFAPTLRRWARVRWA